MIYVRAYIVNDWKQYLTQRDSSKTITGGARDFEFQI